MTIQTFSSMPVQFSPELAEHSKLRASQFAKTPESLNFEQWIALMEPGISATKDDHGKVTYAFDPSKTQVKAESSYAGAAAIACAVYNAMPAEARVEPPKAQPATVAPDDLCTGQTREISYWWGGRIWFNHCSCNDVELVLGGTVAFTGMAAGILAVISGSTTVAPPVAAVATVLSLVCVGVAAAAGTYLAAFTWADTKSGNGAYLNFTWFSPGTPWVTPD